MKFQVVLLVLLVLGLPLAAVAGDGGVVVPLPAPGFEIDRTRSDPERAVRPRGDKYRGPIVDAHVHLDPPRPNRAVGEYQFKEILETAAEKNVERLIFMPTPNDGRFANHRKGDGNRLRMAELGGARIGLMCGGNYLTTWLDAAFRRGVPDAEIEERLARLGQDLETPSCLGTGEIGPYHFDKKGHQAVVDFPIGFGPFLRMAAVTAAKGKWLDLHAEPVEPLGRSREDEVFGGIALLFQRNPGLGLILSHTAMTNPANARALLQAHPRLMMNFKIVRKHGKWRNLEPITDANGNIYEDWARLFEAYPERFMVGTDAKFGRPGFATRKYRKEIKHIRRLLGVLDAAAADLIAHGNARRIFAE